MTMKITSVPRTAADVLQWQDAKGLKHLHSLVCIKQGDALYNMVLKVGKAGNPALDEVRQDYINDGKLQAADMVVLSHDELYGLATGKEFTTQCSASSFTDTTEESKAEEFQDNYNRDNQKEKEQTQAMKATEMNVKPVVAAVNTSAGTYDAATAIAGMLQATLGQALNPEALKVMVAEAVATQIAGMTKPTVLSVRNEATATETNIGVQHFNFPLLLAAATTKDKDGFPLNVYLNGGAATGKTTAAKMIAKALGVPFFFIGAIDGEHKLWGFIDANGHYNETPLYQAWSQPSVFLFDEVDGSDPSVALGLNSALANGMAPFANGNVTRHPDCIVIAGGNTAGTGATVAFTARNKLDTAFLDRFVYIDWPIDETLERLMVGNDAWVSRVQSLRNKVIKMNIRDHHITPRASVMGAALLAKGLDRQTVEKLTLKKGLSDELWAKLIA